MQVYADLIKLPVSLRTKAYAELTTLEKHYCNNKAALEDLKGTLFWHDINDHSFEYTAFERPVLIGKIALLEQEIESQEKQLKA